MRRPLLLPAALLAALTALALIGTALSLRPTHGVPGSPADAGEPAEAANRKVALRFYAAANVAIAIGDQAPLAELVAPDLLADGDSLGGEPGRAGLARRLRALHATVPALRLTVEALAVDGDLVLARVGTEGGPTGGAFLGLDLVERPVPWGPVDELRVVDGRVVSFAGGAAETGLLEPSLAARFDDPPDAGRVVYLQRVTLAAGADDVSGAVDGLRLLYLEAGTIAVVVDATAVPATVPATPEVTLTAGQHLAVPAGAGYAARNAGGAPAVLLDLYAYGASHALQPPGSVTRRPDPGIDRRVLAAGVMTEMPAGPVVLAIGRVTLAPGARLAWAAAAGPVLLRDEVGAARLDPGVTGTRTPVAARDRIGTVGDEPLVVDTGYFVAAGNPTAVAADAGVPLTVLVVTWLPAA